MRSSSVSEFIDELRAILGDSATEVSQDDLATLLGVASRLFVARSEDPYGAAALARLEMSPTEACTVAVALLRAQSLTPFELSIWYASANVERS